MLEYQVYDQGAVIGTATAERDGLYWQVHAACHTKSGGFVRLYAHGDGKCERLGVLIPEGDALRLSRRIAASAFSFTDATRITTSETPKQEPVGEPAQEEKAAEPEPEAQAPGAGEAPQSESAESEAAEAAEAPETEQGSGEAPAPWEPFSGSVLEYPVVGARIRRTDTGALLAIPYEAGVEFPLMPLFCFCRLEEAEGRLCWLIELDGEEKPVMPEEKKPLTSDENVLE